MNNQTIWETDEQYRMRVAGFWFNYRALRAFKKARRERKNRMVLSPEDSLVFAEALTKGEKQ